MLSWPRAVKDKVPGVFLNLFVLLVGLLFLEFGIGTLLSSPESKASSQLLYLDLFCIIPWYYHLWKSWTLATSAQYCFPYIPTHHETRCPQLNQKIVTLTRKPVEGDIDSHGQILSIIIFDCQKCVVFLSVEILKGENNQNSCYLLYLKNTMRATIVNMPPVVEVSSWSVWIFLKKSKDFNIVDFLL